jgi:hypothetical protein
MPPYYRITDDLGYPDRWHLGGIRDATGVDLELTSFAIAQSAGLAGPLVVEVFQTGIPLDFTFAAFDIPVLHQRALDVVTTHSKASVQVLSASVRRRPDPYGVLNVVQCIDCLDEQRSRFVKWTESDNNPYKIGQYRQVTHLRLNSAILGTANLFRVWGWNIALVCSSTLKTALESIRVTGVKFEQVSD